VRRRSIPLLVIAAGGVAGMLSFAVSAGADSPPVVDGKIAPAETKDEAGPPPNLETVEPGSAVAILGKKVQGPSGENMGLVVDVVVGDDGAPRAAVIDFGGFLGVGSRKIGVAWALLHFRPDDHDAPVMLELGRAQVKDAPEYKEATGPLRILGPSPAASVPSSVDGR
jgi:hypothetical protein